MHSRNAVFVTILLGRSFVNLWLLFGFIFFILFSFSAIAVGHGNGAVIIAHDNGTNTIVLHRNVVVNKNTDVGLQCSGNEVSDVNFNWSIESNSWVVNGVLLTFSFKASWIRPENTVDRAEIRNEGNLSFLSIRNVTESDSNVYTCQKSGIIEHFHLRVIGECMFRIHFIWFLERMILLHHSFLIVSSERWVIAPSNQFRQERGKNWVNMYCDVC